jgi:hypothetical protein
LVVIVEDNEVSARMPRSPHPVTDAEVPPYQERIHTFLGRIVKDGLYDAVWFVVTAPPPHFTAAERTTL